MYLNLNLITEQGLDINAMINMDHIMYWHYRLNDDMDQNKKWAIGIYLTTDEYLRFYVDDQYMAALNALFVDSVVNQDPIFGMEY